MKINKTLIKNQEIKPENFTSLISKQKEFSTYFKLSNDLV